MPATSPQHLPVPVNLPIVHIVRPAQGGMVSQVRSLIQALPEREWLLAAPEEVVRALAALWPEERRTNQQTTPLYVVGPPHAGPRALLRHGDLIGRWAKTKGAGLMHSHGLMWAPLFSAAARRANIPLVVTLHNLVPGPATLSAIQRIALPLALSRAERIIAVSEAVAESARRALGSAIAARLRVVRNGIETAPFEDAALPSRAEARRALALPPDAPLVVCIARLSPEKGIGDLIEAVAQAKTPNLHALVAGDGPLRDDLVQQIAQHGLAGRFLLAGRREDIPRLLRAADIAVAPSRLEGLGIAALEAMAAGLPVVAAKTGGLPEVVVDGKTGRIVPPVSPADLAAAIDSLFADSDRLRAMGAAGRERVRTDFTVERMAAETDCVYGEALTAVRNRRRGSAA